MTKKMEELLFKTIEEAMEYGQERCHYSDFDFTELYQAIELLEKKNIKQTRNVK